MKKRYRTYVINGKKAMKNVISAVIGVAVSLGIIALAKQENIKIQMTSPQKWDKKEDIKISRNITEYFSLKSMVEREFPFLKFSSRKKTATVFNEKNADAVKIIEQNGMLVGLGGELPIREINSAQSKAIGVENILVKNETSYSVNTKELLKERLGINMNEIGPKVLILHTHGSEAYTEENRDFYVEGSGDRNSDTRFNVVYVGDKITEVFEKAGIEVIHDRQMHDLPSYNGSYASSLASAERFLKEYPSIQVILDIHRDAIVYSDGTKAKTVTEIDGEKTAQLMFVVGTNAGGLTHDNWRENLKFAVKLQNEINKKYPTLMRGINLRKERFNGHTTKGSLIIEVGTSGNTLGEAVRGATLAAEVTADFLNGL